MSWEKAAYTRAGAALLAESISGGALTITRAATSTGTADSLEEAVQLSGDIHKAALLGIETIEDEGQSARKVGIRITGEAECYICHQIGVYGVLNDGPEETLLFVMQDDRGVEIPAASTASDFAIELAAILAISSKADISLHIDPQIQALQKLVDESIKSKVEVICGGSEPQKTSVLWINENWRPRSGPVSMMLDIDHPKGDEEIVVEIEGVNYAVENAALNAVPTENTYSFTVM